MCLYINCCSISWTLISYSNFISYLDTLNTDKDPYDPKPTDKEDIEMEFS
jgi:hypothetical protein